MRDIYMIHVGPSGSVFVKTYEYYRYQGGFREGWGMAWIPIVASSIENARELGCEIPGARPFYLQAK